MNTRGFTLVELLMTTVILALLLMVAVGSSKNAQRRIRAEQTRNIHAIVSQSIGDYYRVTGDWPAGQANVDNSVWLLERLESVEESNRRLALLPDKAIYTNRNEQQQIVDGYRRPIRYEIRGGLAGRTPRLTSLGEDANDPSDDITTDVMIDTKE